MMWAELEGWEKRNHCQVFMVISTEEVREDLREWNAFSKDCEEFICDIDNVSEKLIFESLKYAYENINFDYGVTFETINELCYDYIVEKLSSKATKRGWGEGQIYNSETKTFESVRSFLARQKEKKNAS